MEGQEGACVGTSSKAFQAEGKHCSGSSVQGSKRWTHCWRSLSEGGKQDRRSGRSRARSSRAYKPRKDIWIQAGVEARKAVRKMVAPGLERVVEAKKRRWMDGFQEKSTGLIWGLDTR